MPREAFAAEFAFLFAGRDRCRRDGALRLVVLGRLSRKAPRTSSSCALTIKTPNKIESTTPAIINFSFISTPRRVRIVPQLETRNSKLETQLSLVFNSNPENYRRIFLPILRHL